MNAFDAAAEEGREDELHHDLVALFVAQNQSGNAATTRITANSLRVSVAVP